MRLLAAVVALLLALDACGAVRHAPGENTGLGAITAISMEKTGCYGVCPAYGVRFLNDGRAQYAGGRYAPIQGRFSALFDFAPFAAWVATQHPETLRDTGFGAMTDAPAVNLTIDYGARRVRLRGISESSASLRLEGILLAVDGAIARTRWRRDDAATAFLGAFRGGVMIDVAADSMGGFFAYAKPSSCPLNRYTASVRHAVMKLRCDRRTSELRIAGDDLDARGDAIPPGRYVRVNPAEMFSDTHWTLRARPAE